MLSLNKAKSLKSAGLQWEPDFGDLYWREECNSDMIYCGADPDEDDVWLPRLDQLLGEINRISNYGIALYCFKNNTYEVEFAGGPRFQGTVPENAAADALIWILTKGGLPMGD